MASEKTKAAEAAVIEKKRDGDDILQGIKVSVVKVIFKPDNAENSFRILRVKDEKGKEFFTKGDFGEIKEGMRIVINGEWTKPYHDTPQFNCSVFEHILPTTKSGMVEYLGCGCVPGCSKLLAMSIVAKFGLDTFKILDTDPDRLIEVIGIGKKKKEKIKNGWQKQKTLQNVEKQLFMLGVSPKYAKRIRSEFGNSAIKIINENPYKLCDAPGITFQVADQIALRQGIGKESKERMMSAVLYELTGACRTANTYMEYRDLENAVCKLTDVRNGSLVRDAVHRLEAAQKAVMEGDAVFKMNMYAAEVMVADKIKELVNTKPMACRTLPIKEVEKITGVTYDKVQREAIMAAAEESIVVITGGPGTGKSTILAAILTQFEYAGLTVKMVAPTGRAAKRMTETTGSDASTAHRLLMQIDYDGNENYYRRGYDRGSVDADVIIMDEASMADISLMGWLISYVEKGMRFVIIGDADQLPSVGPGTVLKDIIRSGVVRTVRLQRTFRQGKDSLIIRDAEMINRGITDTAANCKGGDVYFLDIENNDALIEDRVVSIMTQQVSERFGYDIDDIQVITPINKDGTPAGAVRLNRMIQDAVNPRGDRDEVCGFRAGDRIMNIRNDYGKDIYNGDVGKVMKIDMEDRTMYTDFDGRTVEFDFDEMDYLRLCYATTVHKAQGSEYPVVIMPLTMCHRVMLQRTLFYTAVTRAKKLLILVGEKGAGKYAIRNTKMEDRKSRLYERLTALNPSESVI